MKYDRIYDEKKNSFYIVGEGLGYEYANPLEQLKKEAVARWMILRTSSLVDPITLELHDQFIREGLLHWSELLEEFMSVELPIGLEQVLQNPKKKEQIKLLKEVSMSPYMLSKWEILAWQQYGYTASRYTFKHLNSGEENLKFPRIIHLEGEKVRKVGNTTMTEGEMRHAVNYKNGVVVNILDKGEEWHCLFNTYASIAGRERHNDGTPHFHYISDKWGISRTELLQELSKKNYSLPALPHIELKDYQHKRAKGNS